MHLSARSKLFDRIKQSSLNTEAGLFIVRLFLLYAIWKVFFYVVHRPDWAFYNPWMHFVAYLGSLYAGAVTGFMSTFEQSVTVSGIRLTLYHKWTIAVEEHCIALPAMFLFTASILLFKGEWWRKLAFIVLGLFGIACINFVRIFLSAEAFMRLSRHYYDINHSVIYVIITYGFILMMIDWWMKHQTLSASQS